MTASRVSFDNLSGPSIQFTWYGQECSPLFCYEGESWWLSCC